jgi:hypothetical protein
MIRDRIASGEGIRGQFTDSQVAERILLRGIDLGLCILPIHDGFITTAGDGGILEMLTNEAFREVTGHSAGIKPESFDLSLLSRTGRGGPRWVTRSDGTVERDGPLEGSATSYSEIVSGASVLDRLVEDMERKNRKKLRDKEWKLVHGQ